MRLVVDRLGHRGDGIAGEPPVYVRRALPGEEVEGEVVDGRLASPRILSPSAHRVRPPCAHYRTCGGCDLMHASDAFVTGWRMDIVRAALDAHGLSAPVRRVVVSPPQSRRRAVLTGVRTKSGAVVGFHSRASDRVVPIPGCEILLPPILEALPHLEALTRIGAPRRGEIRIAVTATRTGLDVDVRDAKPMTRDALDETVRLATSAGLARVTWNGETCFQAAVPVVSVGPADVVPPPGAFLQATEEGEAALVAGVLEAVDGARRVADLFSGAGTFSLPLAARAEVHAVEGDTELLSALDAAWRRASGLKQITCEARDLFRRPLLAEELSEFEAVVVDPPRAGAEAQTEEIALGGPPRLAAVSCNPATFARDTRRLSEKGYDIVWIDVVDQFRWSPHIELVAALKRRKK